MPTAHHSNFGHVSVLAIIYPLSIIHHCCFISHYWPLPTLITFLTTINHYQSLSITIKHYQALSITVNHSDIGWFGHSHCAWNFLYLGAVDPGDMLLDRLHSAPSHGSIDVTDHAGCMDRYAVGSCEVLCVGSCEFHRSYPRLVNRSRGSPNAERLGKQWFAQDGGWWCEQMCEA